MDVIQIAQHADDLPRARAFYERLLSAEPAGIFDPPGLLFFRAGDVRLLLEHGATSALIYLKVDDVRETIESLRSEGVEIVAEPHLIFSHTDDSLGPAGMDEWMAFVKDSEGNTVGLVSHISRSILDLTGASGRMHAAFVVVRCPLTPYDTNPLRSSRARPTAWDGITPTAAGLNPVATPLQE